MSSFVYTWIYTRTLVYAKYKIARFYIWFLCLKIIKTVVDQIQMTADKLRIERLMCAGEL